MHGRHAWSIGEHIRGRRGCIRPPSRIGGHSRVVGRRGGLGGCADWETASIRSAPPGGRSAASVGRDSGKHRHLSQLRGRAVGEVLRHLRPERPRLPAAVPGAVRNTGGDLRCRLPAEAHPARPFPAARLPDPRVRPRIAAPATCRRSGCTCSRACCTSSRQRGLAGCTKTAFGSTSSSRPSWCSARSRSTPRCCSSSSSGRTSTPRSSSSPCTSWRSGCSS